MVSTYREGDAVHTAPADAEVELAARIRDLGGWVVDSLGGLSPDVVAARHAMLVDGRLARGRREGRDTLEITEAGHVWLELHPAVSIEVSIARKIEEFGSHTGYAFQDRERAALNWLVGRSYVRDDLTASRRYTLTAAGREWLAEQEDSQ